MLKIMIFIVVHAPKRMDWISTSAATYRPSAEVFTFRLAYVACRPCYR